MKRIVLIALFALASLADASEIKIYDKRGDSSYATFTFQINADLQRAWVVMEIPSNIPEIANEKVRIKIPGMSFTNGSIVLQHEGEAVECATVEERGRWRLTRRNVIIPTGRCRFSSRVVKVPHDDGFVIKYVDHLQSFLTVSN